MVTPRDLDRNRKDDYVTAWTASIQQKLPFNILGTATLSRKQRNGCSDHHLREPDQSGRPALRRTRHSARFHGAATWETAPSTRCSSTSAGPFRAASCSRRITCGLIRSTTGALAAGNPTRPRTLSAGRAIRRAATMTFARCSISPPFISCRSGPESRYLSSPGIARTMLGGWTLSAIGTTQTGTALQHHNRSFERFRAGRLCDQRSRAAELCAWRLAHSARRIHPLNG